MILSGLAAAAALGLATAEVGDGWDLSVDPAHDRIGAGVAFEGGVHLTVQCERGSLDVDLGGMSATAGSSFDLETTRSDGVARVSWWRQHPDAPVLTTSNVRQARFFRAGGRMVFSSPTGDARPGRLEMPLPTDSTNLDRVLTACRLPLVDPRDALVDVGDLLLERPRLDIRGNVSRGGDLSRVKAIMVQLSCIVRDGALAECQSDFEVPSMPREVAAAARLGRATAEGANGHVLKLSDPAAAEGRVVNISVTGLQIVRQPF
ncbi:MAG: hypothetical protein EBR82_13145 [Caulobacteraceae bacterium]|nr:hypothetical protein [Caulobacteraceae bacterium]